MSTLLRELTKSNSKTKHAAFGYARDIENKVLKYKIPEIIVYFILAYHQNRDYFGQKK